MTPAAKRKRSRGSAGGLRRYLEGSRRLSAGNLFQLQKYSDMGGIDLVCRQFYPGSKDPRFFQMAKLGSSISHVYGKPGDVAIKNMDDPYLRAHDLPGRGQQAGFALNRALDHGVWLTGEMLKPELLSMFNPFMA